MARSGDGDILELKAEQVTEVTFATENFYSVPK